MKRKTRFGLGFTSARMSRGYIERTSEQIRCDVPDKLMGSFHDSTMPVSYMATDDSVDIWLHGFVGDEWNETDSLSIGRILAENKGKPAHLRVNSPGGLAYDGVAIFNAIDAHDGPTTGTIEGLAGSAASLAVIACDTVRCYSSAVFHPHYSLIMAIGHQAEIRDALLIQERLDEDMERVYSEASGQSIDEVKNDLMGPNGDGTRMSAEQAQTAGYVDEVIKHNKQKSQTQTDPTARLRRHKLELHRRDLTRY